MLLPHGLIVAVVDGERFELYRNAGDEIAINLTQMESPQLEEHNKNSGARHLTSSANPGHLLREDAHAAAVVDWLNRQVIAGEIKQLVIIAAPRTLGEMRRRYDKHLQAALVGEVQKELIGKSVDDVRAALR